MYELCILYAEYEKSLNRNTLHFKVFVIPHTITGVTNNCVLTLSFPRPGSKMVYVQIVLSVEEIWLNEILYIFFNELLTVTWVVMPHVLPRTFMVIHI